MQHLPKLTNKDARKRQECYSGFFIVNFEQLLRIAPIPFVDSEDFWGKAFTSHAIITFKSLFKFILILGRDFLKKNGSVVDAAIATSFCLGLFSMHSTGIGGGGVMLVYKRGTKTLETFDYRETAPGKSREDMFVDEPQKSKNGIK